MSNIVRRVLIVENETQWQEAIMRCELLRQMKERDPASVMIVEGYDAAKDQLDICHFDVALTDFLLEEDESQFAWRNLARLLQDKQIPVIVISAYLSDVDEMAEMVNEYGVVGIFHKGKLDLHKLSTRLHSILGTREIDSTGTILVNREVSWLHLSDLHFSCSNEHDRSIVIDALWRDLERRVVCDRQPDFVVVTGDIAYSGRQEEYELAADFFDHMLKHTGVLKEKLFLVPGNHDVNRSTIDSAVRRMGTFKTRHSVTEILEGRHNLDIFMRRFDGYATFVRDYFSDSDEPFIFDSENYFYAKTFEVNDWRVAVLGLNSAWTSGNVLVGNQVSDKGHLVVGEKQIREALAKVHDAQVKIALMHHPLSYLRDFDSSDVETILSRNCQFLLRGHLHQADVERKVSLKGDMIVLPAGAVYQGRDLVNSYNYVSLDFESRQARAVFRRYSDVQREWLKDLDTTGEDNDGELVFDFRPNE